MRLALLTALVALTAAPVMAESITAKILAFDRVAKIIVLRDKTVWTLDKDAEVPEGLEAGNMVTLTYRPAGDDGLGKVTALKLAE